MPHRTRPEHDAGPIVIDARSARTDGPYVSEEATFLEHRAALDATVLAPSGHEEVVFELESGVLRRPV